MLLIRSPKEPQAGTRNGVNVTTVCSLSKSRWALYFPNPYAPVTA